MPSSTAEDSGQQHSHCAISRACYISEEDDRITLVVMHNASNGRAWFRGDGKPWRGWTMQAPLTKWSGVTVEHKRVIILKLYMCNLMGK